MSRDEEEAGGEKGGGGGDVTHSPGLMERAERGTEGGGGGDGREPSGQLRRPRRRGARREPVRSSPRLIYLNLRNSVSCQGLYIGQAQVAVCQKVSRTGRGGQSPPVISQPPVINRRIEERPRMYSERTGHWKPRNKRMLAPHQTSTSYRGSLSRAEIQFFSWHTLNQPPIVSRIFARAE